jgi:membrane protein
MRIRGAIFALVFVVLTVSALVLIVFGKSIHGLIKIYLPLLAIVTRIILAFRMALMLALFITFFAVLYKELPNRKAGFTEQLPGAVFAAVSWYLFSYGFSIYIEHSHAFNMYGSLTTLILLMFWLYAVMYIVLIGLELNQWLMEQEHGSRLK